MTSLAYPFFRDTAEVVGRLLTLQDDFTTAQVQERLLKKWGDRATTKEAAQKLLHTLVDWEVLRSTKTKGHFLLVARMSSPSSPLQLWLLESLLAASSAEEVEAQQLLRLPEMFPFQLSIGLSDLRRHDGFHLHRQGLDMDMVSVRPVKIDDPGEASEEEACEKAQATSAQPVPRAGRRDAEEASRSADHPAGRGGCRRYPSRNLLQSPNRSVLHAMVEAVEEAMPEPARAASHRPISSGRSGWRSWGIWISRTTCPSRLRSASASDSFTKVSTLPASLWLTTRSTPFYDSFVVSNSAPRQAKCADIRSQFAGLSAIGVLPTPLKTRLEKLWYERVDYLELDTSEDLDRSALEGAVSNHISVLVELVRHFLGHSSDQGKVMPDHPEYWNQGRKKLPFKAGTAG